MKAGRICTIMLAVALFALYAGAADITIGTGTSTSGFPLLTSYHDVRIQQIYLVSELGVTKHFASLALDVSTIPGQTMNNFTIRLKHTDLSSFGSTSVWESSGWTIVYQANLTISAAGWNTLLFTTPFVYNGTQNLMVDISFNNSSSSSNGLCRYSSSSTSRALYFATNSVYGDPLAWANRNPGPYLSYNLSNIRLGVLMATVPNVVGMAQAAAQTAITSSYLAVGSVAYSFNNTVAAGNVISQSLTAGQSVTSQTAVNLVISAGTKYSGSGTEAAPYQIANKWNLLGIAAADYSKYFVLTTDIDLEGQIFTDAIIKRTVMTQPPWGEITFNGTLDGNGHCIRNFTITAPAVDYVGLLGYVNYNGIIKNLGVENNGIQGRSYVGGLAGYNRGTITNCYTTGSVSSYNAKVTAGLSTIASCAGGLIGYNSGTSILNCYSNCSVSASAVWVSSYNTDTPYASAGGLVGESYSTLTNCYSTGSVASYAYAYSSVYLSYSFAGGLAGSQSNRVTNCYSTGTVTASGSGDVYKGGLVASSSTSNITNSFWDTQTSSLTTSAGGTGKTTAEMKTFSTFADVGWDFSVTDSDAADWYLPVDGYPILKWQQMVVVPDVAGMPIEDAKLDLASAGLLVGLISVEYSDSVPAGSVIRQSPAADQTVSGVIVVNLVNSLGPVPVYGGGRGTLEDPYRIWTAEQMNILGLNWLQWNKNYILMADIDMSVYTGSSFKIIGNATTPFTGIFDGNGHRIQNVSYVSTLTTYVGLFGFVNPGGQIKNLRAENVALQGNYYVGGLVGWNKGSVTSCGITGFISGGGTGNYVGGIVGYNSGIITSCYSTGNVIGMGQYQYVGGLVGMNDRTIFCCYSTGSVSGSGTGNYSGGLVGYNSENAAITSCYAAGCMTGAGYYARGLVSYNLGEITSCFWDIQTSGMSDGVYTGYRPGIKGKTTAEMKMLSTFTLAEWDFSMTDGDTAEWYMTVDSYPQLKWQQATVVPDVVGTSMTEAQPLILSTELLVSSIAGFFSDSIPGGTITIQSPPAGQTVFAGTTMTLGVSLGTAPSGSGTSEDPYQIWTAEQMYSIGLNSGTWDKCYILMADIDLSVYTGALCKMIGNSTIPFTGAFDGNGHSIKNIIINFPGSDYIGLFGYVGQNGRIENLDVTDARICGRKYIGALAGYNYGSVSSCYATGIIKGMGDYIGGLTGYNYGSISSCCATGEINGTGNYIGGLTGYNYGSINSCSSEEAMSGTGNYIGGLVGYQSSGIITHCYSTGPVTNTSFSYASSYIGGLVGYQSSGVITHCYSTGVVTSPSSYSNAYGSYVGGLVGYQSSGTITYCYSTGSVTSSAFSYLSSSFSYAGGLVGYQKSGSVINCYSTGSVASYASSQYSSFSYAGGLTGVVNGGTITNCYSTGDVTASSNNVFKGGLVGTGNSVTNSFWDMETSGQTTSAGGTGKTTAEMKMLPTFTSAGWDFVGETTLGTADIWFIREGQEYPRLLWEIQNDQSGLFSQGFVTISKTRVGRTAFEYELAVTVHNSNAFAMTNVQMKLMDWDAAVQSVLDDSITIESIPAEATVTSTDTFTIVVDRTQPINSSRLIWELTYYVPGGQVQQAMMAMPLSMIDTIPGDITGDGHVNLDDFAIMSAQWNAAPGSPSADIALSKDGVVGIEDLLYLAENWMN